MNINIQNDMIQSNKYNMYPAAACVIQDGLWFCHSKLPVLYYYDLKKRKITFCRVIPEKYTSEIYYTIAMCVVDNNIYIAPFNGKYIIVYDIVADVFEEIMYIGNDCAFQKVIRQGDMLIFIPCTYDKIVKYSLQTHKLAVEDLPFSAAEKYIGNVEKIGDAIFCAMSYCGEIWIYDLKKSSWRSIEVLGDSGYNRMFVNNEKIYVHEDKRDKLKCINISKGNVCAELMEDVKSASPLSGYEDKIIVNSEVSGEWLLCDEELNVIEQYPMMERLAPPGGFPYVMRVFKHEDGKVYYCDSRYIWTVNMDGNISAHMMTFEPEQEKNIRKELLSGKIMQENDFTGLKEFVNLLLE